MESRVFEWIEREQQRQDSTVELIASENFVSENVLKAVGSCLINKYSEGYPEQRLSGNKGRYYGGCQIVDELEEYCCSKWKEVFKTEYHVNVQPHSGSQANFAAFASVLNPGDTVLSMSLSNGGHLTHGSPVNFSGKLYRIAEYGVDAHGYIDEEDLYKKIVQLKPRLVLCGASAYPRIIDFAGIKKLIDEAVWVIGDENYRPYMMVDMAHIAGLVAAGEHPSPFGLADIITTTTHKTLRGARGGLIFCKPELARAVDKAVFPYSQGGALQNMIAGKAVAAEEACREEYRQYIHNVVENCKAMSRRFMELGFDVVTGGTDNHLFLIDLSRTHPLLTGKAVQDKLDEYGITLNKNSVPGEKRKPAQTSGVRIGTAAMTTKGFTKEQFIETADRIAAIINGMQA